MRFFSKGMRRKRAGEMNKLEAAYARELTARMQRGEILWFAYETIKLRLADKTYLTPDFFVLTKDMELECHETKGSKAIFMDDAKVKIKVAAETYPFRFYVIYKTKIGWDKEEV